MFKNKYSLSKYFGKSILVLTEMRRKMVNSKSLSSSCAFIEIHLPLAPVPAPARGGGFFSGGTGACSRKQSTLTGLRGDSPSAR